MLNTKSIKLVEGTKFKDAFASIPDNQGIVIRDLYAEDALGKKVNTGCYQVSTNGGESWMSPVKKKVNKDGLFVDVNSDSKSKLANTKIFYDTFIKPEYAGSDATNAWLTGNIDGCKILDDEYSIQGLIISDYREAFPRFYLSFERLVCENQFGTLGRNSSSMYVNMNQFLDTNRYTKDNREKLSNIIMAEVEKRIGEANRVYNKLAMTHLTDEQIKDMFERLTINTIAKENEERYHEEEQRLERYMQAYMLDDNQNFRRSLFGFVNACTNINSRERTSPLSVIKPVLSAQVIDSPMNFEYLCRNALVNNVA